MSNVKLYFWVVLFAAVCTFADENETVSQWRQMMQYQNLGAGFKSKIKPSEFFISPSGATDPQTELQATLTFFQQVLPASNQHPQCVYPARYSVLKKAFKLAAPVFCQDISDWKSKYQMSYVSLFYAGPYMSSPSSVFGHSFLLLGSAKTEEYSQLTFNFAADIPSDVSAFNYAFKGITGGFPGTISILPYYQRLYQYTDMENRDLWEYRLNLTSTEVELLANYIWEIKSQVNFDYYFFDENCASILLWILKAIKPQIDIATSNSNYVLPSEVTQVAARESLVDQTMYHPALLKRLKSKINQMSVTEKAGFQNARAEETVQRFTGTQLLLEALQDHLNIERHRLRGELPPELKPLERDVLLQRSQIQKPPLEFNEAETPLKPDTAHPPVQIQIGAVFRNSITSTAFSLRPGVHGFLDYSAGYLPNSSVKILELQIQAVENKRIRLQKLTLLELSNFSPVDFYQSPLSWGFALEVRQNEFNFFKEQLFGEIEGAAGYSFGSNDLLFYSLLAAVGRTTGGGAQTEFEIGPKVGFIYSLGNLKANTFAANLWQTGAQQVPVFEKFSSEVSYRLSRQYSILSGYELLQDLNETFKLEHYKVALEYYF